MRRLTGLVLAAITSIGSVSAQGFTEGFGGDAEENWYVADYDFSHPKFDTDWHADHATFDDGLHLSLTPQPDKENDFAGASVRREEATHYGRYSVLMQPAAGEGIITGFFTYTGAAYGTRHDEIDIEFLGRDTTAMNAAWFVDGVLQSRTVPLGFDAADEPRLYSFEWLPDAIRWYVDDRMILEVTRDDGPLPEVPGMLFANLWAADPIIDSWSGTTRAGTRAAADVYCMSFTPLGDTGAFEAAPSCAPSADVLAKME
ncbi:family 16 glycosylhydrolase [Pseudoroseicyclus aestuarii]|uniref:Beta-glucanase n=1 Tax=Pseudoroseicyclus aestuarii TaxID=1795041 RepID=A0A318SVW4_9RHOB|nr:family 16 glycosylhydrolase [Pseudoroseicyclus aestuarii]PYE85990.1 beta-glucanase (GH16 family) [Pseudoroseicyclus aestuarii]